MNGPRLGLALRLSALVLTATALVLALVVAATYHMASEVLLKQAEEGARTLAQSLVQRIESRLAPIPRVPRGVAYELEDGSLSDADILRRQRRVLADNDEIFGMAAAFEPGGRHPGLVHFAPYTFRTPLGPKTTNLGGPGYRYHHMDWYQIPRELGKTVWSEPYYDEGGGNALMTTCSVPFYREKNGRREIAGVVTADVSLDWLKRLVASVNVLDTGYAYLITGTGTYVTHPAPGVAFNETIFSRAEEHGDAELRRIGRDMVRGATRFVESKSLHTGKDGYLVFAPLPSTGWSLGVFHPKDELLAEVRRLALVSAGLGGLGFVILAALVAGIARTITTPLRRLAVAAGEIARGGLDAPIPEVHARDEVRGLAEAFAHMQESLKGHIRQLTEATASRERMESELRIARDIQMGILPKLFPPFPHQPEIDLFASLEPAREVGGDFYDFFSCGADHFCFLVGDVSGKGVPAAFYMAVAKTLIKAVADSIGSNGGGGPDPGRILTRASDELARDNDSCMFVTIFCAVIDLRSGQVRYACAGHNPPALLRPGSAPEFLPARQDPVAGAMEGVEYATDTLLLAPGEGLLLYTDGVSEAMDPANGLYGEERLLACLERLGGQDARSICAGLDADVHAFAAGAEQSDDITMLALHYQGPNSGKA